MIRLYCVAVALQIAGSAPNVPETVQDPSFGSAKLSSGFVPDLPVLLPWALPLIDRELLWPCVWHWITSMV